MSRYVSVFYKRLRYNFFTIPSRRLHTVSEAVKRNLTFRTHTCGELCHDHIDQEVTLCGWINYSRFNKFIVLCDGYGSVQVLLDQCDTNVRDYLVTLPIESVVQLKGVVQKRPLAKINKQMATGEMEIHLKEAKLLSSSLPVLPCTPKDFDKVGILMQLKYRYLYLRKPQMLRNLRTRHRILKKIRDYLDSNGFIEVETPVLLKKSPGGAKEFIVPSAEPGKYFALAQSPQMLKQMLMVARLDKYFQIARCFRNEGTKKDRQPEFTQIDIEESFVTAEGIMTLVEGMLRYSWPKENPELHIPFPCMTYKEAMHQYGSDKPDLRYEMKLHYLTEDLVGQGIEIFDQSVSDKDCVVAAIVVPTGSTRISKSQLNDLKEKAKMFSLKNLLDIHVKKDLSWNSVLSKHASADLKHKINETLNLKPQDLVLISAGKYDSVIRLLGKTRVQCAEYLESSGFALWRPDDFKFLWVVDFPLFVLNSEGHLESSHHPFTAPHPSHVDLVYSDPIQALSQSYDLVLNGQEIGGGSIRINDSNLQRYILEEVLKISANDFDYLLEALECGCPPHGGIALGADRLMAIVCGSKSIADVIAYPKSGSDHDLLLGAPSPLPDSEVQELIKHLNSKSS